MSQIFCENSRWVLTKIKTKALLSSKRFFMKRYLKR